MSNAAPTDALRLVNPRKDITENLRQAAVDLHPWFVGDAKTFSVDCALPAYLNDAADEIERLRAAAPASPLPGGGPTCQLCASKIEGWICQGCGSHFCENDAGALVLNNISAAPTGDA